MFAAMTTKEFYQTVTEIRVQLADLFAACDDQQLSDAINILSNDVAQKVASLPDDLPPPLREPLSETVRKLSGL